MCVNQKRNVCALDLVAGLVLAASLGPLVDSLLVEAILVEAGDVVFPLVALMITIPPGLIPRRELYGRGGSSPQRSQRPSAWQWFGR